MPTAKTGVMLGTKMTHDKLLDTIGHWNWIDAEPLVKALRLVVELHAPCTGDAHDNSIELINEPCVCVYCPDNLWPCDTVQLIEKELSEWQQRY